MRRVVLASTRILGFAAALTLSPWSASVTQAQSGFTVRGRVVERGPEQRPIQGATVRLGEDYQAASSAAGEFEIRNVRPGRYSLTVEALGYSTAQTALAVLQDTEGLIQLDPSPIPLDTLAVQPPTFSIRGRITDRASGRSIPYATVRSLGAETSTNDAGGFRLRDRARGTHAIRVEGFGWLPLDTLIVLEADTVLALSLEPDPIMGQIIAAQVEKLSIRSRSVGVSRYEIGRDVILDSKGASPLDVLKSPGAVRIWECSDQARLCVFAGHPPNMHVPVVCIDDRQVYGLEVLELYPNAMIHRMEVLSEGLWIRAYTTRFIEQMVAGRVRLQPFTQRGAC